MIGMQYNLQGRGALEIAGLVAVSSSEAKWKKQGSCASNEPISVLEARRSPSPSTSTSTLSSSFGGGGGGSDQKASIAGLSDNNPQKKWPVQTPPETGSAAATGSSTTGDGSCSRKDEWAAELHPIPVGMEMSGAERFGLGLEDWESLLSEAGQDQSLLRWVPGDTDDASFGLKQLLQGVNPSEIEDHVALNRIDQNSSLGPFSAGGSSGTPIATNGPPSLSCAGVPGMSSNDQDNGKANLSPALANGEGPHVGLNNSDSQNSVPASLLNNLAVPVSFSPGLGYQEQQFESPDEKPQIFSPQLPMNQLLLSQVPQNLQSQSLFPPSFYTPQPLEHFLQPQPKRQNLGVVDPRSQISKVPLADMGAEFSLGKQHQPPPRVLGLGLAQQMQMLPPLHLQQKPLMVPKQEVAGEQIAVRHLHHPQQQHIYDQLFKAAELITAGNFSHAQLILARLNHQLSPIGKPFQRAAFYFKEALQLPLLMPSSSNPTPLKGIFKMGAYKNFSEVSPLVHFMNFTSNQALLEALDGAQRIHIVDFDIGFGAQWSSFMQELPGWKNGTPSLKITAFASPSTHHPAELGLMHDNLTQFANEIGINFELEVVNFDTFDPSSYSMPPFQSHENEAVAVNFPIWSYSSRPSALPSLLRFIKQLSPKIVVSLECGCDRVDLPFSQHLLQGMQYYEVLMDSIDAANVASDTVNKIERFLLLPRMESAILGRLSGLDKMIHWKTLFASAGFSPVAFSNFAETLAEYVVKKTPGRGYHVERRQTSLVLFWQRRELMVASAWRC